MAPRPRATAATCTSSPASLPSTVMRAARRPSTTPRLMTNRTLGPGTTMMRNDSRPKAASRPGSEAVQLAANLGNLGRSGRRRGHGRREDRKASLKPSRPNQRSPVRPLARGPDGQRVLYRSRDEGRSVHGQLIASMLDGPAAEQPPQHVEGLVEQATPPPSV